jgi:suppressor of ftsI/bilirubin oxidase
MTHTTEPAPGAGRHDKSDRAQGDHIKTSKVKGGKGMHRRRFLGGMAGTALGAVAGGGAAFSLLGGGGQGKARRPPPPPCRSRTS